MIARETTCALCQRTARCRHSGLRWLCDTCWNALFPRDDA